MRSEIRSVLGSELVKVSSFTALSTFVKMLTGFVSVKVFATLIGPGGLALLGQLSNFSTIILTVASGGINTGITKNIAENRESRQKVTQFIGTSTRITLVFSLLSAIFLVLFSGFLSRQVFRTGEYQLVFVIFGLTVILYAFNNLLLSVLNGFKEYRKYVVINIITSLVGLGFSILLVLVWNVMGALVSFVTYQSVIFFITLAIAKRSSWFNFSDFTSLFNHPAGKQLLKFSLMTLVSATVVPGAQLLVRSYMVENLSIDLAGIWEGLNRVSGMYLMIITTSLSVYYLPKLSETKTPGELRSEILKVFRFIIPVMFAGTILIFLARDLVIRVLFTAEFRPMRDLFRYQLAGDFFKIATWIIAYQMWAKGMTIMFISTEIIFNLTFVLLSVYLVSRVGLAGATIAYLVNYVVCFVTMIILFRKQLLNV